MNTEPSFDDILEAVIQAIETDIVPALSTAKAHATAAMMQAMLQSMRQTLPVYDAYLVDEHNDMTRTLRDVADTIGAVEGPAADRIRERALTMGRWDDLPAPLDREQVMAAHRQLGHALEASMIDLDELQRAGDANADAALLVIRAHLGPRFVRDVATQAVGGGMLGRG